MVSIAVAIPTIGRASLDRTLAAIAPQVTPGDEVFVVYDAHHGPNPDLRARAEAYGPQIHYREHDAGESYQGLAQTNLAFTESRADYVLSHSDDDVFEPGAFETIRQIARDYPNAPILFRCISPGGNPTWPDREPRLQRHKLGGGSLACPRAFLRPYNLLNRDGHDYYWVCECLAKAAADGRLPVWTDAILMRGRNAARRS